MAKRLLTEEQVEAEIKRLSESKYVRLARKAERVKNSRRQYLYTLRSLEKRGRALAERGVDEEILELMTDIMATAGEGSMDER
jgi:SOS response regulatory protein OraA/RecX